jgi:hypothetical protein
MKHDGTNQEKNKAKRTYEKINTIKISRDMLLNKK